MLTRAIIASAVTSLAVTGAAIGATLTIDANTQHQTIDGFGAFGGSKVWWSSGPFYDNTFLQQTIDDLGATILRDRIPATFELSNDNGDANSLDLSKFNFTNRAGHHAALSERFPLWRAMNQHGLDKFILSYWSPPAWMKTNNDIENGGELRPQAYAEFAEYCVASVKVLKDSCGVDVYALSVQNEPAFEESYVSCVYTAEQYRDLVKVVGARLNEEYPSVKLFGAEDMLKNWVRSDAYPGPLMADPVSREHLDILAVHGYSDGVNPTPSSTAATLWARAAKNCASVGKNLWMTETSGFDDNWSGTMDLAEAIYAALKYGKVAAWVYWTFTGLIDNGAPTLRYYASKQFYRYIRPGAVMIDIDDTADDDVFAVAFNHPQDQTLTVVLLNLGSSSQSISLEGDGIPAQLHRYVSTSSKRCTDEGAVSGAGSVTLPAASITTLTGGSYQPSTGTARPHAGRAHASPSNALSDGGRYSLDGRLLRQGCRATGVYVVENVGRSVGMHSTRLRQQ